MAEPQEGIRGHRRSRRGWRVVVAIVVALAAAGASWLLLADRQSPAPGSYEPTTMRQTIATWARVNTVTIGTATREVAGLDLDKAEPVIRPYGPDGQTEAAQTISVEYVKTTRYHVKRTTAGWRSGTPQAFVAVSGWVDALPLRYTRDGRPRMVVRTPQGVWAEIEAPDKAGPGRSAIMRVRVRGTALVARMTTSGGQRSVEAIDLAKQDVPLLRALAADGTPESFLRSLVEGATVPLQVAAGTVGFRVGTPQQAVDVEGTVAVFEPRYVRDGELRAIVLLADGACAEISLGAAPAPTS
jgi:hypothetical protein